MSPDTRRRLQALAQAVATVPEVQALVLYGSRARGEARDDSDWDLGYLATPGVDPDALLLLAVDALGTDAVDLVDLHRASGLLRFRVAQDGRTVFERAPGIADRFRLAAAEFWCDVAPVIEPALEGVLTRLPR